MAVNTTEKDFSVEYTSVSGILYVIIDGKPLCTQTFDEHVKLNIVFNFNNNEVEGRRIAFNSDRFQSKAGDRVAIRDIKLEQEPLSSAVHVSTEDAQLLEDNKLWSSLASEADEMPGAQELQNDDDYKATKRKSTRKISKTLASKRKKRGSDSAERCSDAKRMPREVLKTDELAVRVKEESGSAAKRSLKTKIKAERCSDAKRMPKEVLKTDELAVRVKEESGSAAKRSLKTKIKSAKRTKTIKKDKDLNCQYCCKLFETEMEFKSHNRIERKEHHCVKCNRVLFSKAHLLLHMDDHEKEEAASNLNEPCVTTKARSKRKCPVCGKVRSNFECLKIHVKIHTGENEYKCCICGFENRAGGGHSEHMRKHINDSFGQVTCRVCKIIFASRDELAAHRASHTFPCSLCGMELPNQTTLNCHFKKFHEHDGLNCHLCDKIFSSREALESHVEYHNRQKKTQCPTCGGFYSRLKLHIEHMHSTQEPRFVCDKCPKQFKSKKCLHAHIQGVHSDRKPYECPECSKSFTRGKSLQVHMRLHSPDRPYVCEICGKACKIMGNLRHHMKTHQKRGVSLQHTTVHSDSKQHNSWFPSFQPNQEGLLSTDEDSTTQPTTTSSTSNVDDSYVHDPVTQ